MAERWDNNGNLFIGQAADGSPRYTRTQQYVIPALTEARRRFDPHAAWPEGPGDWEFERGRDEDQMTPEELADVPF